MYVKCPICSNKHAKKKYVKNSYRYFECVDCGHLFLNPIPSRKLIDKLYRGNYEFRVDKLAHKRFVTQAHEICRRILRLKPNTKTLLDIGTGYGTFPKVANELGLKTVGLEPANNLFQRARQSSKYIVQSTFEEYAKATNTKFDSITLIHVIEHVREPIKTLRLVKKTLAKNGVIFIETPNSASWLSYIEKERYTFLTPPDHIHLFSPKSLTILIRSVFPNAKLQIYTYSYPEHFIGILRIIKKNLLYKQSLHAHENRGNKSLKLKRSDKMIMHRRDTVLGIFTRLLNLFRRGSIMQIYANINSSQPSA